MFLPSDYFLQLWLQCIPNAVSCSSSSPLFCQVDYYVVIRGSCQGHSTLITIIYHYSYSENLSHCTLVSPIGHSVLDVVH